MGRKSVQMHGLPQSHNPPSLKIKKSSRTQDGLHSHKTDGKNKTTLEIFFGFVFKKRFTSGDGGTRTLVIFSSCFPCSF